MGVRTYLEDELQKARKSPALRKVSYSCEGFIFMSTFSSSMRCPEEICYLVTAVCLLWSSCIVMFYFLMEATLPLIHISIAVALWKSLRDSVELIFECVVVASISIQMALKSVSSTDLHKVIC